VEVVQRALQVVQQAEAQQAEIHALK
jgi:hypothetical protein